MGAVNKKICDEAALIPTKRMRNKIAGYVTHLMKRIAKGPVRGISFALQEEERERKDNYVPEFSAVDTANIEIDADTKAMLRHMGMDKLPGLSVKDVNNNYRPRGRQGDRERRPRAEARE
jgi:small subunit ribosomal protein S17e